MNGTNKSLHPTLLAVHMPTFEQPRRHVLCIVNCLPRDQRNCQSVVTLRPSGLHRRRRHTRVFRQCGKGALDALHVRVTVGRIADCAVAHHVAMSELEVSSEEASGIGFPCLN